MGKSALAYLMSIPALAIFAFGAFSKLSFWLSGPADAEATDETPLGARGAWNAVASVIFSRNVFRVGCDIFLDAIVGRRLFRLSKARWAIHAFMLFGFLALLFGDAVATWLSFKGSYIKDAPALALVFELGGLSIIAGVTLAIGRRLLLPEERLRGVASDYGAPALMALVLATGFLTEAFRLLAEDVPAAAAKYSFVGSALAGVLGGSGADWVSAHDFMWLVHATLSFAFIAYIPYGKFFHFMVAPLVAGMNAGAPDNGDY
jgi:nitrate reductase gamma subunit